MEISQEDRTAPPGVSILRLHPWTLLQRLVISLPGFVILLVPVIRSPSSANWLNLGIAAIYGAVTLPLIYLQYYRFRYWITPTELVIHSGVLTRRRRNIPVDRIQNIDIQRKLLPRILGTASVKVFTAGSSTAEGVLEYVSAEEASRIREVIRGFQRQSVAPAGSHTSSPDTAERSPTLSDLVATDSRPNSARRENRSTPPDPAGVESLVSMPLERVFLSGVFRFSLLYIAIIFSFLQLFEPDPEQLAEMLARGRYRAWTDSVAGSPWMAGAVAVAAAAVLSWISGIAVNLNKFYGFRLWRDKDKLHRRHGLLTLSETTVPLKKVQALICRSNPVMARFHWWALELQTMGLNLREQGHQVAAPFSREEEVVRLSTRILPVEWPKRLKRVSRLTIRRMSIRYSLVLLLLTAVVALLWRPALYAAGLLPLIPIWAWLRYRQHGYALVRDGLVIRRGVIRKMIWYIPVEKMHVFYSAQSIFQRRLNLKTVYVDTAGASSMHFPTIVDLSAEVADELASRLYSRFKEILGERHQAASAGSADSRDPGTELPGSSFALPVPGGR